MKHKRTLRLSVFCMVFMCMPALSTLSPWGRSSGLAFADIDEMIQSLEMAAPRERGRRARDLGLGAQSEEAVPALIEIIQEHQTHEDPHFIACCIIAMSYMGADARPATSAIQAALDSTSAHIRYSAAQTLGRIWEGEGNEEPGLVTEVNTALLSSLEVTAGAEIYGPGLALVRINDIPATDVHGQRTRAQNLEPPDLKDQVRAWFGRNQERLVDFEERSWPLLARAFVIDPDSQQGIRAREMLVERRPLASVDYLAERMKEAESVDTEWERMADLLGGITQVAVSVSDARAAEAPAEYMSQWLDRWHNELKTRKDEEHRDYTWSALESAIRAAKFRAYPEDFALMQSLKDIVIQQFDSIDHIPAGAGDIARELVEEHLRLKIRLGETKDAFIRAGEDPQIRARLAREMLDIVTVPKGREVGYSFLDGFAAIAREEDNARVLAELSQILTAIGGIPVRLDENRDERVETLEEWMQGVQDLRG